MWTSFHGKSTELRETFYEVASSERSITSSHGIYMENDNHIRKYTGQILPFLPPLKKCDSLYEKEGALPIIDSVWDIAQNEPIPRTKWIGSNRNWIYTSSRKDIPLQFSSHLCRWEELFSKERINYYPIFSLIDEFNGYGVNHLPILKKVHEALINSVACLKSTERRLEELSLTINTSIFYQDLVDTGISLPKLAGDIKWGDFSIYDDSLSRRSLESMMKAIENTPGAAEWFRTDGSKDINSPILRKLSDHPAIEKMGHSGYTMGWTLAQFRDIYQNGWNQWVLGCLISRGVGWDTLTLDQALVNCNEECVLYQLKKYGVNVQTAINIINQYVLKYEWEDVGKYLLEKFTFSSSYIDEWKQYSDNNRLNGIRRLFATLSK